MRNRINTLIFFIILVSGVGTAIAQKSIEELTKEAKFELASERYNNAKELLTKLVEENPEEAWFHYGLGISSLYTTSFESALTHIKKAYQLDSVNGVDKTYDYWLGRAYHQNQKFELAIKHYTEYINTLSKSDKARLELETLMKQAEVGKKFISTPTNTLIVTFENGTNSEYDDHSPIIANNGSVIYYTSKMKIQETSPQDKNGDFYESVFVTVKNEMGVWSVPQSIRKKDNEMHEASIQMFNNDQKMLAYRGEDKGKIFILKLGEKGNWLTADQLIEINKFGTNGNATVSDDGNKIIFSFKAKGMFRQDADLYFSTKDSQGKWSEPQPLAENINTTYDETSPFLSPDGTTLYFSSNSDKSMGGFDIFKSTVSADGKWSTPENLGYPVNTAFHDVNYQENKDKTIATFASHREGGEGQLDIYMAYSVQMMNVEGVISNEDSSDVEGLSVYFNTTGDIQRPFSALTRVSKDGTFEKQLVSDNSYRVFITRGDEVIKEDTLKVEKTLEKGKSMKYVILLTNPKTEETSEEVLNTEEINSYLAEGYSVSMLLFGFDGAGLSEEAQEILQSVLVELKKHETSKVELTGHTDDTGPEGYNLYLSELRANMAADYLVKHGVSRDRIVVKAMGEKKPLNKNKTRLERSKNRRLEIKFF